LAAVTPGHATDAASDNVAPGAVPSIVIVLLNNNGGGIFDMLPQRSEDAYFERLFLTPQDVEFGAAAQAFGVPHRLVETVAEFDAAYDEALGVPGISLVEVRVPLEGLPERYAPYWS
ncbi:MAG: thiamine pyrophosphate-dependent enzyme, partial [Eggerthella lenta]